MRKIIPGEIEVPKLHHYLLGSIGPRPICFASTIDAEGRRNLSPFSFFNVFSANPPILVFSPARSGRTGMTKNTHDNVKEVAEVVINVVTYDMVQQMSLTSSPYAKGVDEFVKGGFTPVPSDYVRPYRVAESPIQIECKVIEVKELGDKGAAGNLIICEVLCIHIKEEVMGEDDKVDQRKLDLVARMGGNWYCRASGEAMFELKKPLTVASIGVDALPEKIRTSEHLHGNHLGRLGNLHEIPTQEVLDNELSKLSDSEITLNNALDLLDREEALTAYAILHKIL